MEFLPWMQWLIPLLSAILGGGGIWALLAARAAGKATERAAIAAASATERAAVAAASATERAAEAAAGPAERAAVSADWTSLMGYWQQEMTALRADANRLEVRVMFLERQREDDLALITELEAHIWAELPPPPPSRRRPTNPAP